MNEMNLSSLPKKQEVRIEFLGETNTLITYSALSTHFTVTQGTVNTNAEAHKWLHFTIDDKELYVSKVPVRVNLHWDHLYSKGLVYGTNDSGLYPTGTPTNQYKTINIADKLYKCRLLKGGNEGQDPYKYIPGPGGGQHDTPTSITSEWSRIFYPIVIDDPNITSYTGPILASYTMSILSMRYINTTTPGCNSWCQETYDGNNTQRLFRGNKGPSHLSWVASSVTNINYGWRPVLEIVP